MLIESFIKPTHRPFGHVQGDNTEIDTNTSATKSAFKNGNSHNAKSALNFTDIKFILILSLKKIFVNLHSQTLHQNESFQILKIFLIFSKFT